MERLLAVSCVLHLANDSRNMSAQRFSTFLAMLALCLIAILPFASRIHYVPLPQWFGEINVVWLLLAAAVFVLPSGSLFRYMPRSAWWCLAMGLLWAGQPFWVEALFPGMNYATALAWLAAALLAAVTMSLREEMGERPFAVWLAWALILGGLVQAAIGVAQLTGYAAELGLFYDGSHPTSNIFGHIGQRNQYAHYLMWSVVAGVYLYAAGRLPRWGLSILVLGLALMLGWAGSRTILLYLVALSGLAALWHWRIGSAESRRMLWAMWLSCLVVLAMQFALPWFNQLLSWLTHENLQNTSGLARLAANGDDMGSRRFAEMHKAWLSFQSHPLTGVGWSQFAAESVRLQPLPQFAASGFNSGLFTNSHNLVLQLLAEMGGMATLLIVGGFAWVLWPFFGRRATLEGVLALGCLAVTLTHSMLEYPLWYYYFLAMLVIFAAMAPRGDRQLAWPLRLPLFAALVWVGWLSISSLSMFWELVGLYTPTNDAKRDAGRMERLIEIADTKPLFAYHALYTVDDYLKVGPEQLERKLALENRLTAFRPYPEVMLKRAQLEVLAGKQAQAEQTLRTTLASFPTYAGVFLSTLDDDRAEWEPLRAVARAAYAKLPAKYQTMAE